ncbi:MAG: ABC transporter substrate-binding protein [Bauldia sp.]|nr:ABC transporter substrate-binding protein [Bauldia sp.]
MQIKSGLYPPARASSRQRRRTGPDSAEIARQTRAAVAAATPRSGAVTVKRLFLLAPLVLAGTPALALDAVSFATNWLPEAEHGGFYQAVADGTYEEYGLDVTIVPGGPLVSNRALLLADRVEFYMAGNLLQPLFAVEQEIPVVEIAAIFQKEPQVFIAHPDQGIEEFEDLAELDTLFMGNDVFASVFTWMKANWPGFRDEQFRPYAFNPGPFLNDPRSAQQGYVTSEPFIIARDGGFEPVVFLIADYGFDTPSTMIEAKADYVEANPDIVQRFVDASIIGWYTYLYGDNTLGNDLIKAENPEMTDEIIANAVTAMRERGIADSGIALERGIGCFDDAKVHSFFDAMVEAGIVSAAIDIDRLYTNRFVCQGVGMELRPQD